MNIKKSASLIVLLLVCSFVVFSASNTFAAEPYKLLEAIPGGPGKDAPADFSSYIQSLFNFAVGFVIFAALMMIVIGGFYYITSAGNQAQAGTAKKIITDALLGLVVVFLTYLILFTINEDLVGTSPNMTNLQQGATQKTGASNTQSQAHSSSRVSQTATQPQTYCTSGGVCANSLSECQAAGSGCKASQEHFSELMYYSCDNGTCTEYADEDACAAAAGNCMSGAQAKAEMINNVKTDAEVEAELNSKNVDVADSAKEDVGKMTQKTVDNAKEMGGTITKVESNGAQYETQGAKSTKSNGTQNAQEGPTIKNLTVQLVDSPDGTVTVKQTKSADGTKTLYKYEFSPDHPNKALAGMVATYDVTNLGSGNGKKYSDVKVTAAQSITTCSETGC